MTETKVELFGRFWRFAAHKIQDKTNIKALVQQSNMVVVVWHAKPSSLAELQQKSSRAGLTGRITHWQVLQKLDCSSCCHHNQWLGLGGNYLFTHGRVGLDSFPLANNWNHHLRTLNHHTKTCFLHLHYLRLILKLVWWSQTCKCDI